jgi:BirA family biotin operon repressor/biotin-[acetyl-CoA-carboxylase] ligase
MPTAIPSDRAPAEPDAFIDCAGLRLPLYRFDTVTSTMDVARELAAKGCASWAAITADTQTTGRGTRGRSWASHAGKGLWLSAILPPPDDPEALSGLTVAIADILAGVLREFADLPYAVKHPNDLTVGGRKLAGILVETTMAGISVKSVILGLGLNLRQRAEDFAEDNLPDATSLFMETGTAPDRTTVLNRLIERLYAWYTANITKIR